MNGKLASKQEHLQELVMVLLQLLAVTSRSLSKLNKLTNQFPKQCFPVELELSDMNSIDKALTKLKDFELIDVLVNNGLSVKSC